MKSELVLQKFLCFGCQLAAIPSYHQTTSSSVLNSIAFFIILYNANFFFPSFFSLLNWVFLQLIHPKPTFLRERQHKCTVPFVVRDWLFTTPYLPFCASGWCGNGKCTKKKRRTINWRIDVVDDDDELLKNSFQILHFGSRCVAYCCKAWHCIRLLLTKKFLIQVWVHPHYLFFSFILYLLLILFFIFYKFYLLQ